MQAVAQRYGRDQIDRERPILASWSQLIDYCRSQMAYKTIEQFRILLLDKKNRLIADEMPQVGTVDHTPVYPREVIRRPLELSYCTDSGAQSPLRRPRPIGGRCADDARNRRHRQAARDRAA